LFFHEVTLPSSPPKQPSQKKRKRANNKEEIFAYLYFFSNYGFKIKEGEDKNNIS